MSHFIYGGINRSMNMVRVFKYTFVRLLVRTFLPQAATTRVAVRSTERQRRARGIKGELESLSLDAKQLPKRPLDFD